MEKIKIDENEVFISYWNIKDCCSQMFIPNEIYHYDYIRDLGFIYKKSIFGNPGYNNWLEVISRGNECDFHADVEFIVDIGIMGCNEFYFVKEGRQLMEVFNTYKDYFYKLKNTNDFIFYQTSQKVTKLINKNHITKSTVEIFKKGEEFIYEIIIYFADDSERRLLSDEIIYEEEFADFFGLNNR